jgi:xylulokinase
VGALGGLIDPDAEVYVAGHDHAVAAWIAGARSPGRRVRSIGTTEAVVAVAADAVDRERAWRDGISVVRTVEGGLEAVLAGSPAAGSLIEDWRARVVGDGADPDALLACAATGSGPDEAIALPYPRGRQCPHPDAAATLLFRGVPAGDRLAELHALLRGIAAHGGWMLDAADALSGPGAPPVLVGAPYRQNSRLAGLSAAVAGRPLEVLDLAAPVASGAAALAAVRAGLTAEVSAPTRTVDPEELRHPGFVDRFRAALADASAFTHTL